MSLPFSPQNLVSYYPQYSVQSILNVCLSKSTLRIPWSDRNLARYFFFASLLGKIELSCRSVFFLPLLRLHQSCLKLIKIQRYITVHSVQNDDKLTISSYYLHLMSFGFFSSPLNIMNCRHKITVLKVNCQSVFSNYLNLANMVAL